MLEAITLILIGGIQHGFAALNSSPEVPTIPLGDRLRLPMVGLGVGSGQKGDVANATTLWLNAGGALIDTAHDYHNEDDVAQGIAASGLRRDQVFIETKIPCSTYSSAKSAFASNLKKLDVEAVDITLIHSKECEAFGSVKDTWRALEEAFQANLTRAIGVSHFAAKDLTDLMTYATVKPALNQCELSVSYHDDATIQYCEQQGIVYQSFSPLCGGFNGSSCGGKNVMTVPEVIEVAKAHGVSPAQVGLKWIVQQGLPLVTAVWNPEYMKEDIDLWSWGNLSKKEMITLSAVYHPGTQAE